MSRKLWVPQLDLNSLALRQRVLVLAFTCHSPNAALRAAWRDFPVKERKPSDGLEPSTPSLPSSKGEGSAGTPGKPRARKPRKKKETPEDE
jgi:hypothetical protein